MNCQPGDIYLFDLSGNVGKETGNSKANKPRPCIIVSCDKYNQDENPLLLIVPLTSEDHGSLLNYKLLPPVTQHKCFARCSQIRVVDDHRIQSARLSVIPQNTLIRIIDLCGEIFLE